MSAGCDVTRWQPHLEAARREGKTLKAYAEEHGISRHTLYGARQLRRRMQARAEAVSRSHSKSSKTKGTSSSSFSMVRVSSNPVAPVRKADSRAELPMRLRAQLPNGVILEWHCGGAEMALTARLIGTLAELPCFG